MSLCKISKAAAVLTAVSVLISGCAYDTSYPRSIERNSQDASSGSASAETAGNDDIGEDVITFCWWGNDKRNELTQKVIDRYNSKNHPYRIQGISYTWDQYWDALDGYAESGDMPDIIQMDYSYITDYADNGRIADLDRYIENGTIDTSYIDKNIIDSGKVHGVEYGICNGMNAPALIYNGTLLSSCGISVPDYMSWDEFYEICDEVYHDTGYRTNIDYGSSWQILDYVLRSEGFQMYGPSENDVKGAASFVPFFSVFETGNKSGWLLDGSDISADTAGDIDSDPLISGDSKEKMSWCSFAFSNQLNELQIKMNERTGDDAGNAQELAITTWPSDNEAASEYLKPSQFFSISTGSTKADSAARFIDYLINSTESNEILMGERGIPVSSKVADAINKDMSDTIRLSTNFVNNVVVPKNSLISSPASEDSENDMKLVNELQCMVSDGSITADNAADELYGKLYGDDK